MSHFWFKHLIKRFWQREEQSPSAPAWARCPQCAAALRVTDSFCPQCGTRLSSEGMVTQPLGSAIGDLNQWKSAGEYTVCVYELMDTFLEKPSQQRTLPERRVFIEISYANETKQVLKYRPGQWMLYDTEGYCYERGWESSLFQELQLRQLSEGWLSPGRQVRGWVVFAIHESAVIDYIQFMSGYLSGNVIEFSVREGREPRPFAS